MAELSLHPQSDEPIVHQVTQLLLDAIEKNASDIHIEPYPHQYRIRFRQDGLLNEVATLPLPLALRIATRLKILAQLNIAERRLPQDGRLSIENVDVRLSTCPTLFGEKLVLRLHPTLKKLLFLDQLGMTSTQLQIIYQALNAPQGLILVTGPTGSGKTMTLYAALHYLNKIERNIITIEDPIEIAFPDINQIQLNAHIGYDFNTVLRTLLRQDPDVIMLGEIRDIETAKAAMQAAQTGHLVLATLHTNDAISAITRLQAMGMPTYTWLDTISLVISQRLVRKICFVCKNSNAKIASNCGQCFNGYHERIGIFETLPFNQSLIECLHNNPNFHQLHTAASKNLISLTQTAHEKIAAGITTQEEVQRVFSK